MLVAIHCDAKIALAGEPRRQATDRGSDLRVTPHAAGEAVFVAHAEGSVTARRGWQPALPVPMLRSKAYTTIPDWPADRGRLPCDCETRVWRSQSDQYMCFAEKRHVVLAKQYSNNRGETMLRYIIIVPKYFTIFLFILCTASLAPTARA